MSLLNTKTGFTTPWHCTVALMADGEWISDSKGEFDKNPRLEIILEDGRPSYFKEKPDILHDSDESNKVTPYLKPSSQSHSQSTSSKSSTEAIETPLEVLEGRPQHLTSTRATSYLGETKEEEIAGLAKSLSQSQDIRDEKGDFINPFLASENPSLNPNSAKFSSKAWLEALMGITSRDPERYPKRVAGVAYKNLSAHGFGDPTDYQKTFGNYPFELPSVAKRLIGRGKKTRIQILRNFDGLVKSGEMLVVLGRPGRSASF